MIDKKITERISYCIEKDKKITFLVGAGVSAESGIPTFRGKDGYWISGSKNYKAQEIGTYRMFKMASQEVWKWFLYRKSVTEAASPNAGHYALCAIEQLLGDRFALVSQNVDGLHRKAGSSEERTYLIHGDFDFVRCGDECSKALYPFPAGIGLKDRNKDVITDEEWALLRCPECKEDLRPHVLWFDEYYDESYYRRDTVMNISDNTGLLFIIGTSGATNLPQLITRNVLSRSGMVVEVNLEEGHFSGWLRNMSNGMVLNESSSVFLTALQQEIQKIIS